NQAETLVRVLECLYLTRELETGVSAAYEVLSGHVYSGVLSTIKRLQVEGRLAASPQVQRQVLEEEFQIAGFATLMSADVVGEEFYSVDFEKLAKADQRLRRHLDSVISS